MEFCYKVFHTMQPDKELPFEKLRMALISKWLHVVGPLSPLMSRCHLPKCTFDGFLTDKQLKTVMNNFLLKSTAVSLWLFPSHLSYTQVASSP